MSKFFPALTKDQICKPFSDLGFWNAIKPIPGAVEYVKKLIDEGYNVYLCTATDYRNVETKFKYVIQKYFPYIKWNQVIIASHKQMIKADVLIDDAVHNLKGGNYIKILFTAPHNLKANGMYRANNWNEVYTIIHSLKRGNNEEIQRDYNGNFRKDC